MKVMKCKNVRFIYSGNFDGSFSPSDSSGYFFTAGPSDYLILPVSFDFIANGFFDDGQVLSFDLDVLFDDSKFSVFISSLEAVQS
jgi:hypothetical protein